MPQVQSLAIDIDPTHGPNENYISPIATTYSLFFIDQQNSGFCETENRSANIIGIAAFKISLVNKWKHVAK